MNIKQMKNVGLAVAAGLCLFAGEALGYIKKDKLHDWDDPGDGGRILVNGNYYGENVIWTVTLKAGTAGSLFGDTMGPVETFRYETVVTVDGVEKLVIPGGTWSSNMGDSSYTVKIPLRELGILDKEACGTYYLTAFTRNYSYGSTIDTGYSLITEDTYVRISYSEECDPSKYSLDIKPDHDKTHPDGVMLHVTGTLPKGMPAKIKRDGEELTTITKQGYLFDYIPPSDSSRIYNYEITVEPECGEKIVRSCSGSPGMARVGKMSITNENYQALVVKYDQPENLTVEFTDAEELVGYGPRVFSFIEGRSSRPRESKLEEQVLDEIMNDDKIVYTIDNMKFEEGTHGDYEFVDNRSHYEDNEVGLRHEIPKGPEYEPAQSRVLFMRDYYVGHPGGEVPACNSANGNARVDVNWFRYWDRDGTVDLLEEKERTSKNIRFECLPKPLDRKSLGHSAFHDDGKHWVCLPARLSSARTPRFKLANPSTGVSVEVGAGLDKDEGLACPTNSCHQIAATITHELMHRAILKCWFEDVGLHFAIDGSGQKEGERTRWDWGLGSWEAWRRFLLGGESNRILNDIDSDYYRAGDNPPGYDHLSDDSEENLFRIGWTCKMDEKAKGAIRQLRFDKTKADTYDIAHTPEREKWFTENEEEGWCGYADWSSYAYYGDDEVCARMAERFYDRAKVHNDRDWSVKHPEKLDIRACSVSNGRVRSAKAILRTTSQEDEIGARSFETSQCPDYEIPQEMSLLGVASTAGDGVKADDASYYSTLRFDVTLSSLTNDWTTLTNSDFLAYGYLADDTGLVIAGTTADAVFTDSGEVSVAFDFDGKILYNARGSGYTLAAVAVTLGGIVDVDLLPVACVTNVAGCVRTFDYSEFARPDVVLDKASFTESTDATNLVIGFSAEVNAPGVYVLEGILAASNHSVLASSTVEVELVEGTNVLSLAFSGERISEMGFDGHYKLDYVKLSRSDGSVADILVDSFVTESEYTAAELRPAGDGKSIDYVNGSAGWLEPIEADGSVIALRYGFDVDNPTLSNAMYSVQSLLVTEAGDVVSRYSTNVTFAIGANTVVLDYPVAETIRTGGRFRVRSVTLIPMDDDAKTIRLPPSQLSREFSSGTLQNVRIVTFDANEGNVAETSRKVGDGEAIGALPKPTRDGYSFLGWFTEVDGGTQISPSTVVVGDMTYYAHWTDQVVVGFAESELSVDEDDVVSVGVLGGNADVASSVDVYLTYNTATSADLNLGKTKFPLTLKWAAGEVGEQAITIPVKADKAIEGDEFFTLQLANAQEVELGEATVCTVTIKDKNTNLTLQEGMLSPTVTATTKGDGKWFVASGSPLDEEGLLPLYHVESPALAKGKSSTLALSSVKGMGVLYFSIRFSGDPDEETPSRLDVYEDNSMLGSFSHAEVTNVWEGYKITINSMSGPHAYSFVFTQGSDPNTHAEVSDVVWDSFGNITLTEFYRVYATPDNPAGGIVSGSGWYSYGQLLKLAATPFPGWKFDGWYEAVEDEETGEIGYFLWDKSAKASYKINRNVNVSGFFSKIPYVRGLADPADAGKVSGSGLCSEGKKVTLKATANKGFVFTGWVAGTRDAYQDRLTPGAVEYIATTPSLVIDRSAKPTKDSATSTTITNVTGDATYYACFITSDEDKGAVVASVNGWTLEPWVSKTETHAFATNIWAGVYVEWPVAASALSAPKVKVAGLPAGLKFADKPVTSKVGSGKTAVTVTNVLANTIYGAPTAASKIGKDGNPTPSAVKLTVTTAGKSSQTYQIDAVVNALPEWAVGTFAGGVFSRTGSQPVQEGDGGVNALAARSASGVVSLAIAANGKISGKLLEEGLTWTLSAPWFDEARLAGDGSPHLDPETGSPTSEVGSPVFVATVIGKSGKQELTNEVVVAADAARSPSGPYQDMEWEAYQNLWKAEPWKTFGKSLDKNVLAYAILADDTFSEDEEVLTSALGADVIGRVTVKLAASGAVSVAGEFVAGYNEKTKKYTTVKATGSATLVPVDETHGVVFIYLTPKGLDPHARCMDVPWPQ